MPNLADYAHPQDIFGQGPLDEEGKARTGYGHLTTREDLFGASMGAGFLDGPIGDGVTASIFSANAGLGEWVDHRTGLVNRGFNLDGQLMKVAYENGGMGFDAGVLDANAGLYANDETIGIGATANLVDGAVKVGSDEHNARYGLSAGLGLGARVHNGDKDGDGIAEAGFGVDFGPLSFDIRSEALGMASNALVDFSNVFEDKVSLTEGVAAEQEALFRRLAALRAGAEPSGPPGDLFADDGLCVDPALMYAE